MHTSRKEYHRLGPYLTHAEAFSRFACIVVGARRNCIQIVCRMVDVGNSSRNHFLQQSFVSFTKGTVEMMEDRPKLQFIQSKILHSSVADIISIVHAFHHEAVVKFGLKPKMVSK